MRTDLTTAFQTELARAGRAPVQLLVFHFPFTGTIRVSDRDLGPADGLTDTFTGLVEDFGPLEDIVATDPSQVTIEARQMTVTLINAGANPFSDHFLKQDPENIQVDLYQWFEGLADADMTLIDTFVIADPIRFGERGRLVSLDLVSAIVNMDAIAGGLLSSADWPNAAEEDIGKAIDVLIGNCGRVPTLIARTAPGATLAGSILSDTLFLTAHEDLDALGFSAAGTLQVEEELIRYYARTATTFYVVQRGYLSTAVEHLDRVDIVELVTDHTFVVGRGPVQAIANVKVGGYPAPAGIYSLAPDADPARIVFSQKPWAYRYAAGSSFLSMQFDGLGAGNSAYQGYKAYDAADDATAAMISPAYPVLSLKQSTINPDRGAIVKVYLAIEHWESDTIVNDYCRVWVEGIGDVGRLSRPNPAEGIDIVADVDIDHGHTHEIGGEHTHYFTDPVLQTSEEVHTHLTEDSGSSTTFYPDSGDESFYLSAPKTEGDWGDKKWVYFHGVPKVWSSAKLKFTVNLGGTRLQVGAYYYAVDGANTVQIGDRNSSSTTYSMSFQAIGDGVYQAQAAVWGVKLEVITETIVLGASTGANTSVAISGRNATVTSDKKAGDVKSLVTDNVQVNVTSSEASTKSHVNLYDLTSYVAFDWSWFNDRDVKVIYTGATDNKKVYILHCFFDVEYRARESFFSDDITAEVVGLTDDGTGTYTGTPGALITRPDHVVKRLLIGAGGFASANIDAATFDAAGARLAEKNYTIDGLIRGNTTIKEAIKKIAWQARIRPFFSGGLAKCRFVETMDDWTFDAQITPADYQLNSIAIERQPAASIVNQVDLFYARTWTDEEDGPAGFGASVRAIDAKSMAAFGVRNNTDQFLFDLVRQSAMAADLAQFYVERLCAPSSFYTINGYLPWFAIEKEDKVRITAGFNHLNKAPMRVLGATRVFGSGKNQVINHVSLLLESLRFMIIDQSVDDLVTALDALDVSVGLDGDYAENLHATDWLFSYLQLNQAEEITIADTLTTAANFNSALSETITPAEALTLTIGVGIEDNVNVIDDVEGWRQFGFGGGKYGVIGFGGWLVWYAQNPDEIRTTDIFTVELNPGTMTEDITIAEQLAIHSGFGCPIGDGFGQTPYGN